MTFSERKKSGEEKYVKEQHGKPCINNDMPLLRGKWLNTFISYSPFEEKRGKGILYEEVC